MIKQCKCAKYAALVEPFHEAPIFTTSSALHNTNHLPIFLTVSGGTSQASGPEASDEPLRKDPTSTSGQRELVQTLWELTNHDLDVF